MNHYSFEVFSASRTLLEFCIFMVIYMYTIPEQNSSDQHLQRICQIMKWNYWFHILSLSLNYRYIQYLRQGDRHLAAVNYIFSNLSQSMCTTMYLSIFFCRLRFFLLTIHRKPSVHYHIIQQLKKINPIEWFIIDRPEGRQYRLFKDKYIFTPIYM